MTLCFSRNKHMTVLPVGDNLFRVINRLEDAFFSAEVEIEVTIPDLEVVSAKGEFSRSFNDECQAASALFAKVVGVRVGSGLSKALANLVGEEQGCQIMADLVFEACDGVILSLTAQQMAMADALDEEERAEGRLQMVRMNPRLLNSCIAFDEKGPLLKGRL
jgi:hypothetical protein